MYFAPEWHGVQPLSLKSQPLLTKIMRAAATLTTAQQVVLARHARARAHAFFLLRPAAVNGAESLVRTLLRGGVDVCFANPGTDRMELYLDPETFAFNYEAGVANTHVIGHGGRIFALEEGSFPYELSREIDTVGPHTYDGKLTIAPIGLPLSSPSK